MAFFFHYFYHLLVSIGAILGKDFVELAYATTFRGRWLAYVVESIYPLCNGSPYS